tara:strand:+ start:225 stop:1556 length:1332 start_codon:yes stop_codon:yes gene_type:complete
MKFKKIYNMYNKEEEKKNILNLVDEYVKKYGQKEYAEKKMAPVSGKVINSNEIVSAVDSCLDGWFTAGRYNKKFEKSMSKFLDIKYFLTCNSGSSANLLAISSLCSHQLGEKRIKKGDEVITCAMGFPTTINPIFQNGLVPVFVDARLDNYNINENKIEKAITKKTKAIMIAHTLGNPFNLEKVSRIAKKYNLYLIEDCCDALGAEYNGKKVGTFGDIATLSFYPAHHLTMGEGGAIFCKSSKLKRIIESLRDWGRDCWCETGCDNTCKKRYGWALGELPEGYDHKYTYSNLGYNLKITDMQAAIGVSQFKRLEEFIRARRNNFFLLRNKLSDLQEYFILPTETKKSFPSWFGFPLTIKNSKKINRNNLVKYLNNYNIGTRLMFAGNIIKQPYLKDLNYRIVGNLKNSDKIMNDSFWVGIYPGLKKSNINYISKILHQYIASL